jgi:hypothetical protein
MENYKFSIIFYFCAVIIFIVNILSLIFCIINILDIDILDKILFISYVFISSLSFLVWEYFYQRAKEIFARIELDYLPEAIGIIDKQLADKIINKDEYSDKKSIIINIDYKWLVNDNLKKIINIGKIISLITLVLFFLLFIFSKSNFIILNNYFIYIIICGIISQIILLLISIIIMNILKKKPNFA